MYEGYNVTQQIIKDYQFPLVDLVLQAPCGCQACEDQVQPGHTICETSPTKLRDNNNVTPVLQDNRWYWSYHGPTSNVDEWLPQEA